MDLWRPPAVIDRERVCPSCGYDMRGINSDRCPECGREYQESVLRRNDEVGAWAWLWCFRWVVFGCAPMLVWAFAAWFMLHFGGAYGYVGAFASGIVCALGLTMWAATRAYEEQDEIEGLFLSASIMIAVGFINFAALRVLLTL